MAQQIKKDSTLNEVILIPGKTAQNATLKVEKELEFSVDLLNADYLVGWGFAPKGLERIDVLVDGTKLGDARRGLPRPDVHEAFRTPSAVDAGFGFIFPEGSLKSRRPNVQLAFVLSNGKRIIGDPVTVPNPEAARRAAAKPAKLPARAPFPVEVLALLRDLQGSEFPAADDWSDVQIERAVDDVILLAKRGSKRNTGLFPYLSYLDAVRAHAEFAFRNFPRVNTKVAVGQKDELTVASFPHEILCIANHLYVLKSHGVGGRLLEFGCFKGYSTSCLSFACHQLGIGFDVFDSFEGLPEIEHAYYKKGEFAGSLDEVTRNVRNFGRIECVEFHKGFFSDSLPGAKVDPLCIWMDVDLYPSSKDVMTILPALPRKSCVFSHESNAEDFIDGTVRIASPDSPLLPIVEAYERLDRQIRGRHLHKNTGVIWEHGVALPVLPYEQLRRLLEVC